MRYGFECGGRLGEQNIVLTDNSDEFCCEAEMFEFGPRLPQRHTNLHAFTHQRHDDLYTVRRRRNIIDIE